MKKILKIGHRGAMGYYKENVLSCSGKEIKLKVDMIELDVHCFNNDIVVTHRGPKKRKNCPTLRKIIDLVNKRAKINIELKGKGTAKPVSELLAEYIKKGWDHDDFLISSFNVKELKEFKKLNPKIKLGFIVKNKRINISKVAKELGVFSVNLSIKLAKKELIDKLHEQGLKVFVWTVNKKRDIKKMISLGVDGLFSDYPDRL